MNMHLTDRMLCPRCGPPFGLILLADHSVEGRVLEGRLGCPNCRERYPIRQAVVDLRPPPRSDPGVEASRSGGDPEAAVRIAALLGISDGISDGVGVAGVLGPAVSEMEFLTELVPSVKWVALHEGLPQRSLEDSPATHVIVGPAIPFMPATFRGIALHGPTHSHTEGAKLMDLLIPGGRLLVESPTEGWREGAQSVIGEVLLDVPEACVVRKA